MEGYWRISGGLLEGYWRVIGGLLEGYWRVRGGLLEVTGGYWRVTHWRLVEGYRRLLKGY